MFSLSFLSVTIHHRIIWRCLVSTSTQTIAKVSKVLKTLLLEIVSTRQRSFGININAYASGNFFFTQTSLSMNHNVNNSIQVYRICIMCCINMIKFEETYIDALLQCKISKPFVVTLSSICNICCNHVPTDNHYIIIELLLHYGIRKLCICCESQTKKIKNILIYLVIVESTKFWTCKRKRYFFDIFYEYETWIIKIRNHCNMIFIATNSGHCESYCTVSASSTTLTIQLIWCCFWFCYGITNNIMYQRKIKQKRF